MACPISLKQLNNTLPSFSGYQRDNRQQEIKNRSRTKGQAGAQPGTRGDAAQFTLSVTSSQPRRTDMNTQPRGGHDVS